MLKLFLAKFFKKETNTTYKNLKDVSVLKVSLCSFDILLLFSNLQTRNKHPLLQVEDEAIRAMGILSVFDHSSLMINQIALPKMSTLDVYIP